MKKRELIITAVASAAAAVVSGLIVGLCSKIKYGLEMNKMLVEIERLGDDNADLDRRLDELEAISMGFDPDDFIFEEDNEDE